MRVPISAVLVVVPARNERRLLAACLDSIDVAAQRVPHPVATVVVLDRCTDGTESVLRGRTAHCVVSSAGCVGAARAAGVGAGLAPWGDNRTERVWIANTDADSTVDPDWLGHHVELADRGADAVLGTVTMRGVPRAVDRAWRSGYKATEGHHHVHGANLGVRASTYLRVGGFAALAVHEDVELARAVTALPAAVVHTAAAPVNTSGRLVARAPGGFAAHLRGLQVG